MILSIWKGAFKTHVFLSYFSLLEWGCIGGSESNGDSGDFVIKTNFASDTSDPRTHAEKMYPG